MILFCMITVLGNWLPARNQSGIITFAVLFGFGSGACLGLTPVLIMGISPPKEVGYRMGTVFAVCGIAALTSPPIAGAIAGDNGGNYTYAAVFSGVNYAIAAVGIICLRGRLAGWKLTTKI